MEKRSFKSYSKDLQAQVVTECIETGNYSAVSSKHGIPVTTIYGWIRRHKNKETNHRRKSFKNVEKELSDVKLENQILKELLKKATNSGSKIRGKP